MIAAHGANSAQQQMSCVQHVSGAETDQLGTLDTNDQSTHQHGHISMLLAQESGLRKVSLPWYKRALSHTSHCTLLSTMHALRPSASCLADMSFRSGARLLSPLQSEEITTLSVPGSAAHVLDSPTSGLGLPLTGVCQPAWRDPCHGCFARMAD